MWCDAGKPAHAASLYDLNNCVKGFQLGGDSTAPKVRISPINLVCQDTCTAQCAQFSFVRNAADLNSEIVLACQSACQSGKAFMSSYQVPQDPKNPDTSAIEIAAPLTVSAACKPPDLTPEASIYRSQWQVSANDTVSILIVGNAYTNKVNLCGKKEITIPPIFSSMESGKWNDTTLQTQWTSPAEHPCLQTLDSTQWRQLNNKKLWDVNQSISPTIDAKQQGPSGICKWSARNSNYTDTGIYIADGDELALTWFGDYGTNTQATITLPDKSTKQIGANMKRLDLAQCMRNLLLADSPSYMSVEEKIQRAEFCRQVWRDTSILEIKPPGQDGLAYANQEPIQFIGEDGRTGQLGLARGVPQSLSLLGMDGYAFDYGLRLSVPAGSGCDPNNPAADINCMKIEDLKYVIYHYDGKLDGFNEARTNLAIRHGEREYSIYGLPNASAWGDNYGGVTTKIRWGGCPFVQGQRTQYAVTYDIPKESDWVNLTPETINGTPIIIENEGWLYFRIERLTPPSDLPPEAQALYTDPGNLFGYYTFAIDKQSKQNDFIGGLRFLIKSVHDVLIGTDGEGGVVKQIYNGIVLKNANYLHLVQALLTFYVVMFGLGYTMGTIKANQQEMIIRMTKVAFVVAMISPTSWQFFGVFGVQLLINGSADLMAMVIPGSLPSSIANSSTGVAQDPSVVFDMFDVPLAQIFSPNTGRKLAALIGSSFFGFISFLLIAFSMILYALSVVKAALMYIYSLIGLSMLMILAPIMLPLMLFQITKQTFDSWWKYLISYALQPVLIFSVLSIANMVFLAIFHVALDFTVCPFCLISFPFTDPNCVLSYWQPLIIAHSPDTNGMAAPLCALLSGIAVFLIAHIMFRLPGAMSELTTRIVTGSPIRLMTAAQSVDQMSNSADYMKQRAKQTGKDAASQVKDRVKNVVTKSRTNFHQDK